MVPAVKLCEKLLLREAGDTASATNTPFAESKVKSGRASLRLYRNGLLKPKLYRSSLWELNGASR